jgi:hypothetical protein
MTLSFFSTIFSSSFAVSMFTYPRVRSFGTMFTLQLELRTRTCARARKYIYIRAYGFVIRWSYG